MAVWLSGSTSRTAARSGPRASVCSAPPSRRRPARELAKGSRVGRPAANRQDCRSALRAAGSSPMGQMWRSPRVEGAGRRPRRGRRRGRLPHDGRRPSIGSVRAWRAPLPIQRPKEQRQSVLMPETKRYAQISCTEAKIYTEPENRAGLPSRRTGLPKCPMVLLPIGAAQRRLPAFLAAFRSHHPSV